MIKHGENLITKNLNVTVDIDIAKTMLRISGYKVDNLSDNEIFYKVISEVAEPYGLSTNNEYDKTSIESMSFEEGYKILQLYRDTVKSSMSTASEDDKLISNAIEAVLYKIDQTSYYVQPIDKDWIQCVNCGCRLVSEEQYIPKKYCPNCGVIITEVKEIHK